MNDTPKPTFAYALGDDVRLSLSGEQGVVIGRAEYAYSEPTYYIRYVAADGRQVENWQTEDALRQVA